MKKFKKNTLDKKDKKKIGLVLQGGAVRTFYTAGVLDVFLKEKIYCNTIYGVSAGSLVARDYIAKEMGRSYRLLTTYFNDPRFFCKKNYKKCGSYFNFDFLFNEVSNYIAFDFERFYHAEEDLYCVATNVNTGEPTYFHNKKYKDFTPCFIASCSLPLLSKPYEFNNELYLDGCVSDPLPIEKAIKECDKVIVILTRNLSYRKSKKEVHPILMWAKFSKYKKFLSKNKESYKIYNDSIERILKLKSQRKIFVIAPSEKISISSTETDLDKTKGLYKLGKKDAYKLLKGIVKYINE